MDMGTKMILITGGLGFIGTHITRALLDLGESCVVVQRSTSVVPDAFADHAGTRFFLEQVDVTNRAAFLDIGERHEITGIVNLTGAFGFAADEPIHDAQLNMAGLFAVLEAARNWQVRRVSTASTIGVYAGTTDKSPLHEDLPLPMATGHGIPAFKKITELLADHITNTTGIEIVNCRISGVWGPGARPVSRFLTVPQLVRAAITDTEPDLSLLGAPAHADDGADLIYVRDCGRAVALLQVADKLHHRTYNVASGHPTTNTDLATAIGKTIPGARFDLPAGRDPNRPGQDVYLDITRLQQDTGYQPGYDTDNAVADYIDWLRAGHDR
jgi:UDP-glucose 4-epimerase